MFAFCLRVGRKKRTKSARQNPTYQHRHVLLARFYTWKSRRLKVINIKITQFCTLPLDFLPDFALCYLNFFTQFCTLPFNFLPGFAHYPSFFYSVLHTTPRFFTRFCTLPIAVFSFPRCKNCIITVQKLHLPRAKTAHRNYSNKLKYKL